MPVVRIIADVPVRYSLDNGHSKREYDPGGLYEVPEFVARAMLDPNRAPSVDGPGGQWAVIATERDLRPPPAEVSPPEKESEKEGGEEEHRRKKAKG